MAWWHAVPDEPPAPKRPPKAGPPPPKPPRLSRMEARQEAGGLLDLPDISRGLIHFVEYLMEAGPTSHAGMGETALRWIDLECWQRGSGVSLQPWECRLLRKLSNDYLTERHRATAFDAPPPWNREIDKRKVAKHIRSVLRG